jgi:hypothetical protein
MLTSSPSLLSSSPSWPTLSPLSYEPSSYSMFAVADDGLAPAPVRPYSSRHDRAPRGKFR